MLLPQQTLGSTKFQCVCIRICCPFFGPSVFSIILFLYIITNIYVCILYTMYNVYAYACSGMCINEYFVHAHNHVHRHCVYIILHVYLHVCMCMCAMNKWGILFIYIIMYMYMYMQGSP